MKKIFKYTLSLPTTELELPPISKFLSIQMQNGQPQLWALVDDYYQNTPHDWIIQIIGTGHELPKEFKSEDYIGTYQDLGGAFVGHVFAKRAK